MSLNGRGWVEVLAIVLGQSLSSIQRSLAPVQVSGTGFVLCQFPLVDVVGILGCLGVHTGWQPADEIRTSQRAKVARIIASVGGLRNHRVGIRVLSGGSEVPGIIPRAGASGQQPGFRLLMIAT